MKPKTLRHKKIKALKKLTNKKTPRLKTLLCRFGFYTPLLYTFKFLKLVAWVKLALAATNATKCQTSDAGRRKLHIWFLVLNIKPKLNLGNQIHPKIFHILSKYVLKTWNQHNFLIKKKTILINFLSQPEFRCKNL